MKPHGLRTRTGNGSSIRKSKAHTKDGFGKRKTNLPEAVFSFGVQITGLSKRLDIDQGDREMMR